MRNKVTVVGAGNVGATTAQRLAERDYADVVLVDIVEGMPQGKALDLNQSGPVIGYEANMVGTNGYEETAGSDIVVITSGFPRQPGMSRDDLLAKNKEIVGGVSKEVAERSPDAIVIVVTNPLDAMCHVAVGRHAVPAPARDRHGRHPRLGPLPHVPRLGARRLRARRDRLRAGRPRRHDGAGGELHKRRRHPDPPEDRRRPARGDRPAHARRWRRGGQAAADAAPPSTRPPRRWPRWSTRSSTTRSACSRAPRCARASSASTACSWACRCSLGKEGVEEIIEIDIDADEQEQLKASAAAVKELVDAMASL